MVDTCTESLICCAGDRGYSPVSSERAPQAVSKVADARQGGARPAQPRTSALDPHCIHTRLLPEQILTGAGDLLAIPLLLRSMREETRKPHNPTDSASHALC